MFLIPLFLLLGPAGASVIVAMFAAAYLAGKFSLWSDPNMPERSRQAHDGWPLP